MRTNPAPSDQERIRAFHEKLNQPSIVEIDDATAYWLEGENGRRIGGESSTSEAPLLAALAEIRRGVDPIGLSLVCNAPYGGVPDDRRYVITSGEFLVEFAESAAGIAARPRTPAPGELPVWGGRGPSARPVASAPSRAQAATPEPGSGRRKRR